MPDAWAAAILALKESEMPRIETVSFFFATRTERTKILYWSQATWWVVRRVSRKSDPIQVSRWGGDRQRKGGVRCLRTLRFQLRWILKAKPLLIRQTLRLAIMARVCRWISMAALLFIWKTFSAVLRRQFCKRQLAGQDLPTALTYPTSLHERC